MSNQLELGDFVRTTPDHIYPGISGIVTEVTPAYVRIVTLLRSECPALHVNPKFIRRVALSRTP